MATAIIRNELRMWGEALWKPVAGAVYIKEGGNRPKKTQWLLKFFGVLLNTDCFHTDTVECEIELDKV